MDLGRRGGISGDHFGIIVPVSGHYPYVMFDLGNGRYTGGIISEEFINGRFESPGASQEWTFRRTSASEYEACRNAGP